MKTVSLLLYSLYREKIGQDSLTAPFSERQTVEGLYHWVSQQYPHARFPLEYLRFAVNGEYVSKDKILSENDEVVFIPPVAGG